MAAREFFGRWGNRAYGALTLWSVLPQTVVGLVTAYLSAGVGWVSQLGPFGIFASGLLGFAVASFGLAQGSRWKLYRQEVKQRARALGDSSPFDPMAPVYQDKRLYLRDLAPMGRRLVVGKRFINCEIIGPGVAMIGLTSDPSKPSLMRNTGTFDVDCIEIDPELRRNSMLAVEFLDCDFDGCKIYHMSLLFLRRENDTLNWITRDSRQALIPYANNALAAFVDQEQEKKK